MKTCTVCGERKPLHDFGKKLGATRPECRACSRAATRNSRRKARSARLREEDRRRERLERDAAAQREKYRQPPQAPAGRVCSEPGCETILSRYNRGSRCSLHAPEPFDPRELDAEARRVLA